MNNQITCTRFAPSPTGFMHIGNLRTALFAYLLAKSKNGRFILRIEDTDQVREVPGAVDVILKTLELIGIKYDEGPGIGGEHGPYIQSQRKHIHQEYAHKLVELGHAYYCFCTKERLAEIHDSCGGYDRHCRDLAAEEIQHHLDRGDPYVIRQKMPLDGSTTYVDDNWGEITVENKELQDQILIKADGFATYNFAHVVDDYLMGVNYVMRGSEYVYSTPKYALLYDAFGWERPHYVHLPLLNGKDSEGNIAKLSKRHGSVSFLDLVEEGYLPEAIVNYIALLGWSPSKGQGRINNEDINEEFFTMDELIDRFSIQGLGQSPSVFDYDKLKWFNTEYIRRMPVDLFNSRVIPSLKEVCPPTIDFALLAQLLQPRIGTLAEATAMVDFIASRLPLDKEAYVNKKNKTTVESCRAVLEQIEPLLDACEEWTNDALYAVLKNYSTDSGLKLGSILWAVRIAIARKIVTPGGATELMLVLGRDETMARIKQACAELND